MMKRSINLNGNLMVFDQPKIMGILNLTPDSFYKDSRIVDGDKGFLKKAEKMIAEGADFLDLGGYSSRPNALNVSEKEEISRIVGPLKLLRKHFPKTYVSIDTFRVNVAKEAMEYGAVMVNDISGGNLDVGMFDYIIKHNVAYVLMHSRGNPQTMSEKTDYDDVVFQVKSELADKIQYLKQNGHTNLMIDPGFGFAKTLDQNYELMSNLEALIMLDAPLLVGISRKSMIYKLLKLNPEEVLPETSALNLVSILKGANILRVHDVVAALNLTRVFKQLIP